MRLGLYLGLLGHFHQGLFQYLFLYQYHFLQGLYLGHLGRQGQQGQLDLLLGIDLFYYLQLCH